MIREKRFGMFVLALALLAVNPAAAFPDFDDETDTRLVMDTVDPVTDGEEKDVVVVDLDRNGWDDVIVVRKAPFYAQGARTDLVLMNIGGTLFEDTSQFAPGFLTHQTQARDVVVADFNGDTFMDVVVLNTNQQQHVYYQNLGRSEEPMILENGGFFLIGPYWKGLAAGPGNGIPVLPTLTPDPNSCAGAAGDVDGDGDVDLFISDYLGGPDQLLINDGSANFSVETSTRLPSEGFHIGTGAALLDMDLDGDLDIFRAQQGGVNVLFNDGSGFFGAPALLSDTPGEYMAEPGLLNDDRIPDAYVGRDGQDVTQIAQGTPTPANMNYATTVLSGSPRTEFLSGNIHFADVDGDGDMDVGVGAVDQCAQNCPGFGLPGLVGEFTILENDGDGGLTDPHLIEEDQNYHTTAHDFAFIDINRDGKLDLFMGLCTGYRVFIQDTGLVSAP